MKVRGEGMVREGCHRRPDFFPLFKSGDGEEELLEGDRGEEERGDERLIIE